jgi:hypothetical protein
VGLIIHHCGVVTAGDGGKASEAKQQLQLQQQWQRTTTTTTTTTNNKNNNIDNNASELANLVHNSDIYALRRCHGRTRRQSI